MQVNGGLIVVATPKELQEMDISLLLELPAWLEDECELDILNMTKDTTDNSVPPFLVIQSAGDKTKDTQPGSPQPGLAGQSGRGASVVSFVSINSNHLINKNVYIYKQNSEVFQINFNKKFELLHLLHYLSY